MDPGQDPVSMLLYRNIGSLIEINAEQAARIDQLKEFIWRHNLEVPEPGKGIKRANSSVEHADGDENPNSASPHVENSFQKRFRSTSPTPADRSLNSISSAHATINSSINSTLGSAMTVTPHRSRSQSEANSSAHPADLTHQRIEAPIAAPTETAASTAHPSDPRPEAPNYSRLSGGMSWALHLEPSDAPLMSPAAHNVGRVLRTSETHVPDPSMVRESDFDASPAVSHNASAQTIPEPRPADSRHSKGDLRPVRDSQASLRRSSQMSSGHSSGVATSSRRISSLRSEITSSIANDSDIPSESIDEANEVTGEVTGEVASEAAETEPGEISTEIPTEEPEQQEPQDLITEVNDAADTGAADVASADVTSADIPETEPAHVPATDSSNAAESGEMDVPGPDELPSEPSVVSSTADSSVDPSPTEAEAPVASIENRRDTSNRYSTVSIPEHWQRSRISVAHNESSTREPQSDYSTRSFVELSTVMLERSNVEESRHEPSPAKSIRNASTASNASKLIDKSRETPAKPNVSAERHHSSHSLAANLSSHSQAANLSSPHEASSISEPSEANVTPKVPNKSATLPPSALKRTGQVFDRIYGSEGQKRPSNEPVPPQERSRVSFMLPPSPRRAVQARFESSPLKGVPAPRLSTGNGSRRSLPRARLSKRWSTATATDATSASYYTARDSWSSVPNDSSRHSNSGDDSRDEIDSRRNSTIADAAEITSNGSRESPNLADESIVSGSVDTSNVQAERSLADRAVANQIEEQFGSARRNADRQGSVSLPLSTPNTSHVEMVAPNSAPPRDTHEEPFARDDDSKKENKSPLADGPARRRKVGARKVYNVEGDGTIPQIDPIVMDPNDISVHEPRPPLKF